MRSKFRLNDSKTIEIWCQCSTVPCIDHIAMQFVLKQKILSKFSEIYNYSNKYVQYASVDIFQEDLKHPV